MTTATELPPISCSPRLLGDVILRLDKLYPGRLAGPSDINCIAALLTTIERGYEASPSSGASPAGV